MFLPARIVLVEQDQAARHCIVTLTVDVMGLEQTGNAVGAYARKRVAHRGIVRVDGNRRQALGSALVDEERKLDRRAGGFA